MIVLLSLRACLPSTHNSDKHNIPCFARQGDVQHRARTARYRSFKTDSQEARLPGARCSQHSTLKSPAPLISTRSSTCSTPTTPPPSNEPPGSEAQPGPAPPFPAPGAVGRQRPAAGRGSRGRALRKAGGVLGLRAAWAGRRSVAGSRFADGKPCELRLCLALRVQHVNVGLLSFMVRACRFASVRSAWREWRERYVGAS